MSVPAALVEGVRALSAVYNEGRFPVRWTPAMRRAREDFFLPRDAAKVRAALRDVPVPAGARVLDLGAGAGASALGVREVAEGPVALTLVDEDPAALASARARLGARVVTAGVARALDPAGPLGGERFDLVVLAQVLVEIGRERAPEARVELLAELLEGVVRERLAPGGRVVVVEPALRREARALQEVRGRLLARGRVAVVGPCTHGGPCPLLRDPSDWCHDDRDWQMPEALVPVARAAGLRWQGLTFARLVLAEPGAPRPGGFRVVAPPKDTRGRSQRLLCGAWPGPDGPVPDAREVDRLDRAASEANADWEAVERGDRVELPPVTRVERDTPVRRG